MWTDIIEGIIVMFESNSCINAKTSLDKILLLQQAFHQAYKTTLHLEDVLVIQDVQALKSSLEERVQTFKDQLWAAEAEHLFHLREQYTLQTGLLKEVGLVNVRNEIDESGRQREILFITGIDDKEYPLPSLADIFRHMGEKKEILRTKLDQGFNKLLLVPFAMGLKEMFENMEAYLTRHPYVVGRSSNPTQTIHIFPGDECKDADRDEAIVYQPTLFTESGHQGNTKREILSDVSRANQLLGWDILFIQGEERGGGIRQIPYPERGKEYGQNVPRKDIEAGKSAEAYLEQLQLAQTNPSSPYYGESGMNLEGWLMAFITHLKETGGLLDDQYGINADCNALLLENHFPAYGYAPHMYYSHAKTQVIVSGTGEYTNKPSERCGARFVIRV